MKTIQLKSNGLSRYEDASPFILADNKFELRVELPNLNGEFFFIAENNTIQFKKVIPEDGRLSLEGLSAGELQAEIKHYLKGALIKTYKIEPLIIREVDGSLSGTPEITVLQTEIENLKNLLRSVEEREAVTTQQITALLKFAYEDYSKNVYLSGGSFDDFVKEFGFKLSDGEIKLIKGVKEND